MCEKKKKWKTSTVAMSGALIQKIMSYDSATDPIIFGLQNLSNPVRTLR